MTQEFTILEEGTYPAVCTAVIGVGPQRVIWQDQEKIQQKIKLCFEVPSERVSFTTKEGIEKEGPMVIWSTYTYSFHENAKLRKHMNSWMGGRSDAHWNVFDIDECLGKPCLITVIHRTTPSGRTYANVDAVTKLMKGMAAPIPEGELISFDFYNHTEAEFNELKPWQQELIIKGRENELFIKQERKKVAAAELAKQRAIVAPDEDYDDDQDVPF